MVPVKPSEAAWIGNWRRSGERVAPGEYRKSPATSLTAVAKGRTIQGFRFVARGKQWLALSRFGPHFPGVNTALAKRQSNQSDPES
jgi:hypothetical protein